MIHFRYKWWRHAQGTPRLPIEVGIPCMVVQDLNTTWPHWQSIAWFSNQQIIADEIRNGSIYGPIWKLNLANACFDLGVDLSRMPCFKWWFTIEELKDQDPQAPPVHCH